MDDTDKPDPATELNELSCWTLEPDSEDNDYFFGSDRESTILGEFGWNYSSSELEPTLEPGHFTCTDRVKADDEPSDVVAASSSSQLPANAAFQRLYSAAPAVVTAEASTTATSNPSVSSSSSEDLPEKSTVSGGGKPGETSTKVKKKGQKRIRQQRFAFMTKSEVDHLEDGYRWRKYGQKAVKNSPFPRSYYRCTNSKCTVKKRVERSSENPTVVITTYEGQHCHHTVGFPRGGFVNYEGAFGSQFTPPTLQNYYQGMQFNRESSVGIAQSQQVPDGEEKGSLSVDPPMAPGLPTDDGLLGDIVPHGMRNL